MSHVSISSMADRPQAVCWSGLCSYHPSPSRALPPSVLVFSTGLQDVPSISASQPADLQLRAGTQALFILKAGGCRSLPFQPSSSSSLRAFWFWLQPATSSSFTSMRASIQILRMLSRSCLKAPAGQCCGTTVGLGRRKGVFCCQSRSKPCFEHLLTWLLHKARKALFLNYYRHLWEKRAVKDLLHFLVDLCALKHSDVLELLQRFQNHYVNIFW